MTHVPNIHFVGIGGIGMSGLAKVLLEAGYAVSGCDRQRSHITDRLAELGAKVHKGHSADHLIGTDLLIISSAIPFDNPDVVEAQRRGIPVVKRAELLGHLTEARQNIAVAGTHGKTTTTGMIAWILEQAALDPTVFAGGELVNLDTNAKHGQGPHVVTEADEYDHAFLELTPAVAVITNIEADHPDIFEDLDAVVDSFAQFLGRVQPAGHIVACLDDPQIRRLVSTRRNVITYGFQAQAQWQVGRLTPNGRYQGFGVHHRRESLGEFRIQLPGTHNVSNALAAIAATTTIGVDLDVVREALASFRGMRRRFEERGVAQDVIVVDDYAHHPTEVQATLAAARQRFGERTVWVVFQPHTYSRTRALLEDFATSFTDADYVIVTDIYAAREQNTLGVRSEDLISRIDHSGAQHIGDLADAAGYVADHVSPGDVVITAGAGDVWRVGERVLELLTQRQ